MAEFKNPKQRYPMSLYRGKNDEEAIVRDEDEETAARKDGFLRWNENAEQTGRSPRPVKQVKKQDAA